MYKDRPLASALAWLGLIVMVGTILSVVCAIVQAHLIAQGAKEQNPSDPLDLLPFLVWSFMIIGFIASTLLGLLVASLVYLTKRREIEDRKFIKQGIQS